MPRIVHFSDTHGEHKRLQVPDGDILIFSGDCSDEGTQREVEDFFKWFVRLPHVHKVFVPGNHDRCFDLSLTKIGKGLLPYWVEQLKSKYLMYESLHYFAEHQAFTIPEYNLKFFGTPYTPKVHPGVPTYWAYSEERENLAEYWKAIPEDIDILISHGPPFGKLDYSIRGHDHVGCERLRFKTKTIKPKAHLFGHVHESAGGTYDGDTYYFNSSIKAFGSQLNECNVFDINMDTKEITV